MAELFKEPPKNILIVMLSALGDAVHVLPVINALKRAWPATKISWIVQPVPYQFAREQQNVDELILFRRRRGMEGIQSYRELRSTLSGKHYDLLINLQVYMKAGLITALADADIKLGFDRARARDMNWLFTNRRIPPHPVQHVQDQYFEFLRYIGVHPEPVEWHINITPAERAAQQEFFSQYERTCGVVVGTSRPEKNWTPDRYARVIETIEKKHGMRCIIMGGPSAAEREIAAGIMEQSAVHPVNALGDDVRRLMWLLDGASLVIAPDTGPLHIRRAFDKPVVGMYGFTNPKRSGPYRKYTDLVIDGYARYPGEDYPASIEYRPGGMERVSVDEVLEKVDLAVSRYI